MQIILGDPGDNFVANIHSCFDHWIFVFLVINQLIINLSYLTSTMVNFVAVGWNLKNADKEILSELIMMQNKNTEKSGWKPEKMWNILGGY